MSQFWLLLDFDNTLMKTEHLAVPSLILRFNEMYQDRIGRSLTLAEFKTHFHGQARENLCENLSRHFGIQIDYRDLYRDREWHIMEILRHEKVEMAPGLIPALQRLQKEGFQFAFVSNNPIQRGLAAMRNAQNGEGETLARFFGTAFFEAGDIQKPKPDVYLRAMTQLETNPAFCFAIEDSVTGASAAVNADIPTLGYTYFADNPGEMAQKLKSKGVLETFSDWDSLANYLILEKQSNSPKFFKGAFDVS
ncbi:HAD family phosphatase [Candidatus Bealeia paramacronuclearis]|uniref:HAD family phosphatase n=1 Tax=Candidatus Bealeia paramacronuclearis TaxID=1921001 RepID=A0ABZ2C708_9PROT|nr:HAD family phosphatase [Candidatus Bealeia paramacronuclearis]